MMTNLIECPLFQPDPGDQIRIVLEYDGLWRAVFWFSVARDGSVYLGPRYVALDEIKRGEAKPVDGTLLRVDYGDGDAITDPEDIKAAKLSIHASGVINAPGGRLSRRSLRELSEQALLCSILFVHPSAFEPTNAASPRKRDIRLNYPINEDCPLWGHLYVAPAGKLKIVTPTSAAHQVNLLFEYVRLDGVPDMVVQFVLGHGATGPWPLRSYLLIPSRLQPEPASGGTDVDA